MIPSEGALLLFTACNTLRVLAYVPQIVRIAQDTHGAQAISYTTWGLFALSHMSTVVYALATVENITMAVVFGVNALACCTILGLTALKRRSSARQAVANPVPPREVTLLYARPSIR